MKEIDQKESAVIFKEGLNYAYFEPIREEEENGGSEEQDINSNSNENPSDLLESIVIQEDMDVEKVEPRKVNFNNTFGEFGESATLKDELLISTNDNEKTKREAGERKRKRMHILYDNEDSYEEIGSKKRSVVSVEKAKNSKKKYSLGNMTQRKMANRTYSTIDRNHVDIGFGIKKNKKKRPQFLRDHNTMRTQPEKCFKSFTSNNKNNRQLDVKKYILGGTKRPSKKKGFVDLNKLLKVSRSKDKRKSERDDGFFINIHKQGRKGSITQKKKDYIEF